MEIKRATLKAFDPATYTATLQVAGSLATWLEDVPVSRDIPAAEMVTGRTCALVLFSPANPKDAVVAAVYTS